MRPTPHAVPYGVANSRSGVCMPRYSPDFHLSDMTRRTLFAALLGATTVGALALLPPRLSAAPFHLRLLKSAPEANDSVASPSALRLWFSVKPAVSITSIKLKSAAGVDIPIGKPTFAGDVKMPVEAAIAQPLTPGRYRVLWKTASTDMHPVSGEFTFAVR